jgi:hypothetical protein
MHIIRAFDVITVLQISLPVLLDGKGFFYLYYYRLLCTFEEAIFALCSSLPLAPDLPFAMRELGKNI